MINLNSFFGNESSNEIELLQVLYKNSGFMDIEELSARLNIDRRSVYKYFELLQNNSYSLESTTNEILISKRGRGYKFAGTKKEYKLLYKKIVESNPFFELLTSLLLNNEVSITKFSIDHFMSESKFLKRLYELNLLF
ncbi:MAG: helix-turn-helix domain-containing protein [Enterococcus hulanensis]